MNTPPRQFRLNEAVMSQLDRIAVYLDDTYPGHAPHSRADSIRHAVARMVQEIQSSNYSGATPTVSGA